MAYSAQELNAMTQRALADPHVQQALSEWNAFHQRTGVWSPSHSLSQYEMNFDAALRAAGMPVNDLLIRPNPSNGQLEIRNHGLPGWSYPLIIGGATVGGLAAAGAFSGAAGAGAAAGGAGGVLPATQTASPIGSLVAGPTSWGAATAPGAAAAFDAASAGANAIPRGSVPGMPNSGGGALGDNVPAWLRALIAGGVGAAGIVGSHQQPELPAEMRDIFNLQKQRMEAQNPLYASILQLAHQRMPTSVQNAQLPAGSGPSATSGQQQAILDLANRRQP